MSMQRLVETDGRQLDPSFCRQDQSGPVSRISVFLLTQTKAFKDLPALG